MAYDESLAERVRATLAERDGVTERKMFGGLAFMLHGNMCCGVLGDELMLRLGPEAAERALGEPHVREMDFTGRPMTGMVFVEAAGLAGEEALERWVDGAVGYASALPPKPGR